MSAKTQTANVSEQEAFVLRAITALRKGVDKNGNPYLGIHVVYSGFNAAFEAHFGVKSRETLDKMIADGTIEMNVVRGGPVIYIKGEKPAGNGNSKRTAETLAAILG